VSLPEADRDELEARYAHDREMSPEIEQPMALTTSNANPGPESVAKTSRTNGLVDVGNLVEVSVTSEKLESVIGSLTDSEKYQYLTRHFRPTKEYQYPSTYMNKCNRSFQESWLTKYPWLVYSPNLDGGFCLPCFLFINDRSGKRILVNSPFTRWTKVSTVLGNHAKLEYHLDCLTKADAFKCAFEDPRKTVQGQFNKELVDHIANNRLILERYNSCMLASLTPGRDT